MGKEWFQMIPCTHSNKLNIFIHCHLIPSSIRSIDIDQSIKQSINQNSKMGRQPDQYQQTTFSVSHCYAPLVMRIWVIVYHLLPHTVFFSFLPISLNYWLRAQLSTQVRKSHRMFGFSFLRHYNYLD